MQPLQQVRVPSPAFQEITTAVTRDRGVPYNDPAVIRSVQHDTVEMKSVNFSSKAPTPTLQYVSTALSKGAGHPLVGHVLTELLSNLRERSGLPTAHYDLVPMARQQHMLMIRADARDGSHSFMAYLHDNPGSGAGLLYLDPAAHR